ncbi:hypothetical protein [Aestuariivita sp.]|jgi:hypothetical protein|uniref:hypothetical protein n=1 Tax=Aestuariivita sp. TaxID=1872407 RepID=UPI00216F09DC|nr:hypothetical protein [Aestuariivita sp.]MCE8007310.1 hypothetical protein [Aestuariivita sp.]
MKISIIWSVFVLAASGATAQDWNLRDSDAVLGAAEMAMIADGGSLTYYDDGVSLFSAGGAYSYTYADGGGTAFGQFRIEEGGQICIDYRNGFARCDMYVRNNGRLVLLTADGERYPVKVETGVAP